LLRRTGAIEPEDPSAQYSIQCRIVGYGVPRNAQHVSGEDLHYKLQAIVDGASRSQVLVSWPTFRAGSKGLYGTRPQPEFFNVLLLSAQQNSDIVPD
jgi:hypothetical protein